MTATALPTTASPRPTPSSSDRRRAARRRAARAPRPRRPQAQVDKPAGGGDFAAEALVHRDDLYASALRYTRNASDAEDLVQDTYLRALAAWDRYIPGSNCRAWLLRILANSFISSYRRRRRHREFAYESGDQAARAVHGGDDAGEGHPARALLDDALGDEVCEALAALGDDYRRVVELADLRGQRYRDIADRLELPIGTVMSRLYRARRQLESRLAGYAAEDYGIAKGRHRAA